MPCLVCAVWGKGAWYVQLGERVPGMSSWEKGFLVCAVGGKGSWYVQLGERVPGMCSWRNGLSLFSPHSELKALKQGL